jgi:hypothetical protein
MSAGSIGQGVQRISADLITDAIGAFRMIKRFEYFDAARPNTLATAEDDRWSPDLIAHTCSISSTDVCFRETPLLPDKHKPGALKANQRQREYDDVDSCKQTDQEG